MSRIDEFGCVDRVISGRLKPTSEGLIKENEKHNRKLRRELPEGGFSLGGEEFFRYKGSNFLVVVCFYLRTQIFADSYAD